MIKAVNETVGMFVSPTGIQKHFSAPLVGKAVMVEGEGGLMPAALDDVRQDFAVKQAFFFR